MGFGIPWCGTSGEQINREVPIAAMVILERGKVNKAIPLTMYEGFGKILPHIQYPSWDVDMTEKVMDMIDDFLKEVPIIQLSCLPNTQAVEVLYNLMKELNLWK